MIPSNTIYPGYENSKQLQYGWEDGDQWTPAECDVSIRPGWFYHETEDSKVKTVDELCDLYYRSVGHNATFLLNFPVDKDGLIHPNDSANAVNFHKKIQQEMSVDVLKGVAPFVDSNQGKHIGKNWVKLNQKEETTTIGYKRILRFDKVKTNGIRIVFDSARACPCINNVAAY